MLNRLGSRTLVLAGFALTGLGYAATAMTGLGLWGYLLASMPVGLGIGVLVSGALRTIAIDEAPVAQRGAAQGLVNIFTSIGTLLAAATIGAVADWQGGGARGFALAYGGVAVLMLAMLLATLGLRRGSLLDEAGKAAV
jgi:MFS family permease